MFWRLMNAVSCLLVFSVWAPSSTEGSNYPAVVMSKTKPALYWEFNETNGLATSAAVARGSGSRDGVFENVTVGVAGPRPGDGLSKMDPQNAALGVNRRSALRYARLRTVAGISTEKYSVQSWFRSTVPFDANAVHTLFGRGNSDGELRDTVGVGGTWNMSPLGKLYFYEPISGKVVAGKTSLRPDRWYHVVMVRDGAVVKVYLNGRVDIDFQIGAWAGGDGEQLTVGNRTDFALKQYAYGLEGLIDEVSVWDRPLDVDEVHELYAEAGPIPPPSALTLFADAATPQPCFIAQVGRADAVIVVGHTSAPFYRWVATEVQRYLRELTGALLPIVTSDAIPSEVPILVVGGPQANPLSAVAEQKRLVDFAGLKPEGFIIQTVDLDGRPAVVIGGNDEAATMYAAYELVERLGVVFQITGDLIPRQRPELKLPAASVRMEPALKNRGLHMRHFVMPWMGLDDFRHMVDQMAKLKYNYLEFFWYVGEPWNEYAYQGEKRQIDRLYTKDSGYLTWHLTAGSQTAKDVKIGRELFQQERVCAPEFAHVQNQEQAYEVARRWLTEAIAYAHQRKIKTWLGLGDCPTLTPNFRKFSQLAADSGFFGTVVIPPGDPTGTEIWHAMVSSAIDTYPEADGYWIWLAEIGVGSTGDAETQRVLRQYDVDGKPIHSDSDLALVHYGRELIRGLQQRHPQAQLGLAMLDRCHLFHTLDKYVPQEVHFMSMESGACWHKGVPVPMERFGGLAPRETFLVPRLDDDVHELAMQFNVALYEFDRVLTGSVQYGVSGVAPQIGRLRGLEHNARYVADGAWNPQLTTEEFYEAYVRRIFGAEAVDEVLNAYTILQENERVTGWQGFTNFCNYAGPVFTPPLEPYATDPLTQTSPPRAKWNASGMNRDGMADAIPRLREAIGHLEKARSRVALGAQQELEYVIFKTESYILHLKTLCAWWDCFVAYDRVVEANLWQDKAEVKDRLDHCRTMFLKARDVTRKSAELMAAKAKDGDETYILFRYNFGLVTPIEQLCEAMANWSDPGERAPSPD